MAERKSFLELEVKKGMIRFRYSLALSLEYFCFRYIAKAKFNSFHEKTFDLSNLLPIGKKGEKMITHVILHTCD